MFSREPLRETFRRVASNEEWQEFSCLSGVTQQQLEWNRQVLKQDPEKPATKYMRIWRLLADRLLVKLRSGEWVGEGINPSFGIQRQRIDSELWHLLDLTPLDYCASGAGFMFAALKISEVKPSSADGCPSDPEDRGGVPTQRVPGSLRRELQEFLQAKAIAGSGPFTKAFLLSEARREVSPHISRYTFDQAVDGLRASGNLPADFFFRGSPKSKGT